MVSVEKDLRLAGLTIVFAEAVAGPLVRGEADLPADIAMMFGYYESGEFLRKHAERVLQAQRQLALGGYRDRRQRPLRLRPCPGRRLGAVLEELTPGRQVRQPGCHVRIVPKDPDKIAVWLMILELNHKGWGCKRIARHLNDMGIPSPGAGSFRTDQGVRHQVSGKWGPNTVKELCENRAILGLQDYGRRSEGAHRRLGQDGHRLLTEADRDGRDRPRVVKNDPSAQITAPIGSRRPLRPGPVGGDPAATPGPGPVTTRDPAGQGPGAVPAVVPDRRPDRRLRLDHVRVPSTGAGRSTSAAATCGPPAPSASTTSSTARRCCGSR